MYYVVNVLHDFVVKALGVVYVVKAFGVVYVVKALGVVYVDYGNVSFIRRQGDYITTIEYYLW